MKQLEALEILKTGKNVFLTGEPGAGKTYTIDLYKKWLDENYIWYQTTASTGIAASHIAGTTIHSFCGMGIKKNLDRAEIDRIHFNYWNIKRIKPVKTLIIDEISMLDAVNIEDINNVLQAIHENKKPFGGIQVVFVGDFFQLPPVNKDGNAKFAFEADAWNEANLEVCYLTEQHRQSDEEFLSILTNMRNGELTQEQRDRLLACTTAEKPDTILFTHNADVDRINATELAKIDSPLVTYEMESGGHPEFLIDNLKKSCLSPEKLELKIGATVMLTRNSIVDGVTEYVNGSIGKIISLDGTPGVELLNGRVVYPAQAEWEYEEQRVRKAWIRQFPLRLAWAITVHKSQGMSLDSASVDLTKAFEFGQGYVAVSRVRTLAGLHLVGANKQSFDMHPKVVEQDKIFKEKSKTVSIPCPTDTADEIPF